MEKKFELGQLGVTPGASEIDRHYVLACVRRHAAGDWGVLSDHDRMANEDALKEDARLWSIYPVDPTRSIDDDDNKLYVITEADRSATTVLLPDEYLKRRRPRPRWDTASLLLPRVVGELAHSIACIPGLTTRASATITWGQHAEK